MNINGKFQLSLSPESIKEYQIFLMKYYQSIPKVAERIVERVSEEGLKDNYKSTEKMPVQNVDGKIKGGIRTTEEKDTYREFGTGIVGSNNPHISEVLAQAGWKYDVNEHGERGWVYPKPDGTFGWTKGIPAQKKFYEALKRMEDRLPEIAKEEFKNYNG